MDNMIMEMLLCEDTILNEISHKECKRKDIALTYFFCLISTEKIDFGRINKEIIERWSRSGLVYIKTLAWKYYDEKLKEVKRING